MKNIKKLLSIFLTVIVASFAIQLASISLASAGGGSYDVVVQNVNIDTVGQVVSFKLCNDGSQDIDNIHFDFTANHFTANQMIIFEGGGTLNFSTQTWSGVLNYTSPHNCVRIFVLGTINGNIGDTETANVSVTDYTLADTTNVVTDGSLATDASPFTIVATPDVAVSTHLLTTGAIATNDNVQYELDVSNVGAGPDPQIDQMNFAIVVPSAADFQGAVDLDTNDDINLVDPACTDAGPTSNFGAIATAHPGELWLCFLTLNQDFQPGQTAPFELDMKATSAFVSGGVGMVGAVSAQDPDSFFLQVDMANNQDPFLRTSNNFFNLTYDTSALQVTVSRCPGQGATTINGTGCFRISFSKPIVLSSFSQSDLVLTGGASVTSFSQLDGTTWEVHVSGIPIGATTALSLAADSVQDFSAVHNDVHVLGENTIRYDDGPSGAASGSTSANGTLAKTGTRVDWYTPLLLVLTGFALLTTSRRRRAARI